MWLFRQALTDEDKAGREQFMAWCREITIDIRHPQAAQYEQMLEEYRQAVRDACDQLELDVQMRCFWEAPGITFDARCIEAVRSSARGDG